MRRTPQPVLPVIDSGFRVSNRHSSFINRPVLLALLTFELSDFQNQSKTKTAVLSSFSPFQLPGNLPFFFLSMASPSQIPTSLEIAAEQNPSTAVDSTRPDPASSPQSDSIDALFSVEAADAVVDSPTSEEKK